MLKARSWGNFTINDALGLKSGGGKNMIPVEIIKSGVNWKSMVNLRQYQDDWPADALPYTGGFPLSIIEVIEDIIETIPGPVLHLYSGRSMIGEVRVDMEQEEATHIMTVEEFIAADTEHWKWVVLDPPYKIKRTDILRDYADARPLSGNALLRDRLSLYLRQHSDNVLWLDYCCPQLKGFERKKIWLVLPPAYWCNVRVLTWFSRIQHEMPLNEAGLCLS